MIEEIKKRLDQNHHYHHCRRLGQLDDLQIVYIKDGMRKYQEGLEQFKNIKRGDIKPSPLDTGLFWDKVMV